jgi:hypothetical protein
MTVFMPVNNHFRAQPFHPNLYFQKHWQRLMLCEQPFLCGLIQHLLSSRSGSFKNLDLVSGVIDGFYLQVFFV